MAEDGFTVIRTPKRLDMTTAGKLEEELLAAAAKAGARIELDMTDTNYINSVSLRALLKAQKKINAGRGTMILTNVSDQVREVFDVTGFSGVLKFEE